MYSKVKKIKSIYKLIAEIKEEIKLPEGFEERKMYHAWVQEPICNVLDTTWYHEIDIKIQNIEKRLNNNINKTSLKERAHNFNPWNHNWITKNDITIVLFLLKD